ncbi:kelch-like protein 40b [Poeciliopsis prolifica]|uniref:kelch-like protein 40b n=1 Tax=Poeciliopsis prolifica TaxID=188132 RepID=UPI0024134299|nr:kelch-like protein 40b [Poeciliopsis prolifica]
MAVPINPMDEPRLYQQTLLQDGLYDLLENDKLVDCVLKIKDKEFPCHRLVLCACSSYFRSIFLSDLDESKKREIVLEDVEPGVIGLILKYLYTSKINVTEQNVQDIFAVANMYQIPSIFTVCVSFLQKRLSLSNCLAIFRLGLMLDCPRLAVSARNYACERFQLISKDEDFLQLNATEVAALLTNDNLNVETEEVVFEALMRWVCRDTENREKELPDLLDCVRLRLVTDDYLKEKVEKHQLISANPELQLKMKLVKDARAGKMPEIKKSKKEEGGAAKDGETEDNEDEENLLPAILNDNLRFGMFVKDLILMVNDTGAVGYDPSGNDCFMASVSTQVPKNHVSLVTKENQIFVIGGLFVDEENKEDPLCSYFLQYDPVSTDWLGMPPLPTPRFLFGMAEGENSIFVLGGKELKDKEGTLDTVLVYDRQSFKWGESESIPYPVYGHSAVSHKDVVYVIGGKGDDKNCLKKMCSYDVKRFEWKELAPMKTARSLFGATLHQDKIYVAGGVTDDGMTDTVEVYDIAANTWSDFEPFPQERSSPSLVSLAGSLYAVGGFAMMPLEDSDEILPKEMNDVWRYNETERKWNGILREIQFASGATVLGVRLNTLRLTKM